MGVLILKLFATVINELQQIKQTVAVQTQSQLLEGWRTQLHRLGAD